MLPDLQGLRLLIVGNWPPPLGGVSVHLRSLRDAAKKAGAHVTVLDIGQGQNRAEGVFPSGGEAPFVSRLLGLLQSNDIVHVHTNGANPKSWILTTLVGLATRASACQAVVTFHSGHGPKYLNTTARALTARLALLSYRRVICVNQEISLALTRIGAAPRRHVVAAAFGKEGVVAGKLPGLTHGFIEKHPTVVSCMLAPGRDYGAPEIFAAFEHFKTQVLDAGLIVYGPGTDDLATTRLAQPLGKSALCLGQIERSEALALMQASQIFVRPTLVDGDAVSVREALALGTRVVATNVGHRPPGITLCAPENPADLARAMAESLHTTPMKLEADSDGIETVLEVYARVAGFQTSIAA